MSIKLPTMMDDGHLEEVIYYDASEVGQRLGFTPKTVRVHTTGHRGDWPHVKLVRSPYMSAEHIARTVDLLTYDPDKIPEGDGPARLGIACSTNDLEDVCQPPAPLKDDDDDEDEEAGQ